MLRRSLARVVTSAAGAFGGAAIGAVAGSRIANRIAQSRIAPSTWLWVVEKTKAMSRPIRNLWWCRDCEAAGRMFVDGHGYMLVDEVWKKATEKDPVDLLCIPCVCARLGRSLTIEDFAIFPINGALWAGMAIAGKISFEEVASLCNRATHNATTPPDAEPDRYGNDPMDFIVEVARPFAAPVSTLLTDDYDD